MHDDTGMLAEYGAGYTNLDNLAAILDARVVSGLIGIEGPPFAGKTTFATKLASELGAGLIPEHTDFDVGARKLALSPWPDDPAVAAARQAYFYQVERARAHEAMRLLGRGSPVVMDRTALSVVVYSLARATTIRMAQMPGFRDLDILIGEPEVRFPNVLYLLQVPEAVLLKRAQRLADTGKPREIEPFLLCPSTLRILNFFYADIASRLQHCNVVVKAGRTIVPESGG